MSICVYPDIYGSPGSEVIFVAVQCGPDTYVLQTQAEISANESILSGIDKPGADQLISSIAGILVLASVFKMLENFILGKKS